MFLLYPNAAPDESFHKDGMAAKTLKSLGMGQLLGMEERELANLLSADPAVIRCFPHF